ncbi:MAG: thiamine-phosphate kinase [Sphingomicrobium sp.]
MMREREVIARLQRIATAPEARGLTDDVAVLDGLVITHDSIAEGVHFLSFDPPASVGWKLVAVNLSDLAAKGAEPRAALLSLTISGDGEWEEGFLDGVEAACKTYGLALIGGDTITLPVGAPRVLGLTAIGMAPAHVPHRSGGRAGDVLWLVGTLGDSAAGLLQLQADRHALGTLVDSYRHPIPQLEAGRTLARHANATMDVSDGLLLDALRIAEASQCSVTIALDSLPLSQAYVQAQGDDIDGRLLAASAGDDYALLAALPASIDAASLDFPTRTIVTRIGELGDGPAAIAATMNGKPVDLPARLGFEHCGG